MWLIEQMEKFQTEAAKEECYFDFHQTERAIAWLEKQKEQMPVEWSEEDEKHIAVIATQLEAYQPDRTLRNPLQKHIDWLKSLRPQSHWKPTSEQMYLLNWLTIGLGDGPVADKARKVMESLYNDLKKL